MLMTFPLDSRSSLAGVSMLHLRLGIPPTRRLVPMRNAAMHGAAMHGAAEHGAAMHGAAGGGESTPFTHDSSAGVVTSMPDRNFGAMSEPVEQRAAMCVPVDHRAAMPVPVNGHGGMAVPVARLMWMHDAGDLNLWCVDDDRYRRWVGDLRIDLHLLTATAHAEYADAGRVTLAHAQCVVAGHDEDKCNDENEKHDDADPQPSVANHSGHKATPLLFGGASSLPATDRHA